MLIDKKLIFLFFLMQYKINFLLRTNLFQKNLKLLITRSLNVLGIETSCDDTGIAIVDAEANVRANILESQQIFHTRYGGIIPPRAQDLHRARIADVFERCLDAAQMTPNQLDAIAVTTRPGLPLSLLVGLRFAKHVARAYNKPLVPIHHMEAHALQARMENLIPYPFLCLLISGGHCQLAFVRGPQQFYLLGESLDDAPGEAFDKISRRLRLYIIPKYRSWNGGRSIEDAALSAKDPRAFEFCLPLSRQRDCNFSFAGIKNNAFRTIKAEEIKQQTAPDCIISNYSDFCASLLHACSRHLMNRTQRALEFCISCNLFGADKRRLIVSGGVANNDYIFGDITHLAAQFDCDTFRPSKKYCSDNGVMIAWNGIEKILQNENCMRFDYDKIDIQGKVQLGELLIEDVERADLKCKWIQANRKRLAQ